MSTMMMMSHVFVEGCIVPMVGGLSGPMSVYVPKAALTASAPSNAHGVAADREDLTLEERKAQRMRLLKWVEAEDRKIAAMEQHEQVQVRAEDSETEEGDEDSDDEFNLNETLAEATERRKEEARKTKANKNSKAKRERAAACFDELPLGNRLRNRQELIDGTTDYLECKKVANQGERRMCEFNGQMMSLRAFAMKHRTTLKTAGKINRDIKGDPLDTMEDFRERKNKFISLSSK